MAVIRYFTNLLFILLLLSDIRVQSIEITVYVDDKNTDRTITPSLQLIKRWQDVISNISCLSEDSCSNRPPHHFRFDMTNVNSNLSQQCFQQNDSCDNKPASIYYQDCEIQFKLERSPARTEISLTQLNCVRENNKLMWSIGSDKSVTLNENAEITWTSCSTNKVICLSYDETKNLQQKIHTSELFCRKQDSTSTEESSSRCTIGQTFSDTTTNETDDNSPNLGLIIGLAVSGFVIIILIGIIAIILIRRRRSARSAQISKINTPQEVNPTNDYSAYAEEEINEGDYNVLHQRVRKPLNIYEQTNHCNEVIVSQEDTTPENSTGQEMTTPSSPQENSENPNTRRSEVRKKDGTVELYTEVNINRPGTQTVDDQVDMVNNDIYETG